MDLDSMQKDCSALAGLFQQIIVDLKNSPPVWEDFLAKAGKLHTVLRTTAAATGAFLDAFQKVADLANNSHGAAREVGGALTRLCIRHRSIENKLKTFASAIIDELVEPLQGKLEEWKKTAIQLDKDHSREYKKAQQELKKASSDTVRLQKRAGKGRADARQKLDHVMLNVSTKYQQLENIEKGAVRTAMIEERSHFCFFISCFKPIMDIEFSMLLEVTRLQEIADILYEHAKDPSSLPPCGEQVLLDLKGRNTNWTYQSPPGSPVLNSSRFSSRKSSICSVDSSSSGSTHVSVQSPVHHTVPILSSQLSAGDVQSCHLQQLPSVSSQDSGFVSHDVAYMDTIQDQSFVGDSLQKTLSRTTTYESSSSLYDAESLRTPTVCSQFVSQELNNVSDAASFYPPAPSASTHTSRPHTISSAYERCHSARPVLTSTTFEPPPSVPHVRSMPGTTSMYATPSALLQRTADIYARPVLCGRRTSQGAAPQPVAPPVVPAEYATCGSRLVPTLHDATLVEENRSLESKTLELHRSASMPSPPSECESTKKQQQLPPTDAVGLMRRRLMLTDDNYISHATATSQDFESALDIMLAKQPALSATEKSLTLPRSQQFKIPPVPLRKSSVTDSVRVKPPPPVRRNSTKSGIVSLPAENSVTTVDQADVWLPVNQDSERDKDSLASDTSTGSVSQLRQQAPPVDDADSLWLAPPPTGLSCPVVDGGTLHCPSGEMKCTPDVATTVSDFRTVETSKSLTGNVGAPDCLAESSCTDDSSESNAVSNETEHDQSAPGVDCTLALIRRGVQLRKTVSSDRSAPKLN